MRDNLPSIRLPSSKPRADRLLVSVIDYHFVGCRLSMTFGDNLSEGLSSRSTLTEVTLAGSQSGTGRLYVESPDLLGVTRSG